MSALMQLDPADREFFSVVARTAFCNPFSEERAELDAQLVGHPVEPLAESHLDELTETIAGRMKKLEGSGLDHLGNYKGRDRELMRVVFLFEVYHRFCRRFDELILQQERSGASSVQVAFAEEALEALRQREIADAPRYFAIFYQLRRAFYFIVHGLKGTSRCMREFRRHLWQNVFTDEIRLYEQHLWNRMEDFSTLLLGETGTGKGTAAVAIGRSGFIPFDQKRSRFAESFMESFVAINLSQFPETLVESELFGHRKGAFTGAVEAHQGVLARCSPHGAIFLDEIGEVVGPIQIKLLQVLQERSFCPVGSHERLHFRGRVIAATNRSLQELRERGLFREDFFYRLCSDVIQVPSLRQRVQEEPGEMRQLVEHALGRMVSDPAPELVDRIERALHSGVGRNYGWPGNVRELEQAIRRILITGSYNGTAQSAPMNVVDRLVAGIKGQSLDADDLLAGYCKLLYESSRSYEAVARRTNLDARTVKKYLAGAGVD